MFFCVEPSAFQNFVSVKIALGGNKVTPVHFTRGCEFVLTPKAWRQERVVGMSRIVEAIQDGSPKLRRLMRYTCDLGALSRLDGKMFFLSGIGKTFDISRVGQNKNLSYIWRYRHSFVAEMLGGDAIHSGFGPYSAYYTVSRYKMGWRCEDKTYLEIIKELK
jgi:hypothetical protein